MKLPDFATRLGWSDAEVLPRLRELELTRACSRCAGSGHYTLGDDESLCWKCRGSGDELPMLTRELAGEVAARVVRGELDRYLARAARRRAAARHIPSLLEECRILYEAVSKLTPRLAAELYFGVPGALSVRDVERLLETRALDEESAETVLWSLRRRLTELCYHCTPELAVGHAACNGKQA